jgi:glycosyltransferase involved in cell wall biosynthesis
MIGVNASIVGRNPTGLGLYTINLLRELDKLRDDLVVYTSAPAAFDGLRAPVVTIPAAVRPDRGMRGHAFRALWLQTVQRARARVKGFRVVLNTVPEAILDRRIPQVTVVHDLLPLRFPLEYPRQQYYFRRIVPWGLRLSRRVIADSESTRADVVRHFGLTRQAISVVYPGYDPATYFPDNGHASPPATDPAYVLYVGNLFPHKNLGRLIDAFAMLHRRVPVRLVIRGHGRPAYARGLHAQVETLGLSRAVQFLGYAEGRSLRELYLGAACLAFPSLGEGFGLPVLEAMACGLPVITARVSSLPEVAGEAAVLIDPADVGELAEAMHRVVTRPEVRAELRRRGLERVKQFSWRRTAVEVSRILDEVA